MATEIGRRFGVATAFAGGGHATTRRSLGRSRSMLVYGGARGRTPYIGNTLALYTEGLAGRFLAEAGNGPLGHVRAGGGLQILMVIADRPVTARIGARPGRVGCAEAAGGTCTASTTLATAGRPLGSLR